MALFSGVLVCVYGDSNYLFEYTFSVLFAVSLLRIWIQLLLQWALEQDSPRFKRLPALLKRHDASLLCHLPVFAFLLPTTSYGCVVTILNGPTVSTLVKIGPGFRIVALLVAVLSILDLSQRHRFDWRLHVHHGAMLTVSAIVGDYLRLLTHESAIGLIFFGFLAAMDEPVWVLWSLNHLRVERSKEPLDSRVENDDKELFPPAWLYNCQVFRKLNLFGFLHYTVLARGGTCILLAAYLGRFASDLPSVWTITLPVVLVFFILIDFDVVKLLYKKSKQDDVKEETGCEMEPDRSGPQSTV